MGPRKHLILGAGLAGLSAGYHLEEPFEIFEASPEIGGVARSTSADGFTFDHAIHVLYTRDPYASKLIRSLLGDNFREQKRSALIYSNNTYTRYPYQTNLYGLPEQIVKENLEGLYKTRLAPRCSAHNFEEWVLATFGEGIARNFMFPFNRKLWAADLRTMGFQWIADRVPQPDIAQIVAGALRPSTHNYGPNACFWYPRFGGTKALPQSFLSHVPEIRTNMRATGINIRRRTIRFQNGEEHPFNMLISTLPMPQLIALVDEVPPRIRHRASGLRSNRVITVNIGVARGGISDAHWIYVPEADIEFHRISFPMNFSETLAPNGTSSIMAEISESDAKPIERTGIVHRAISQLVKMGILRTEDRILHSSTTVIEPAYVIYDLDHTERIEELQTYLHRLGIISCGRFGEWKYLNMDHAILSGKRAAEIAMDEANDRNSSGAEHHLLAAFETA